MKRSLFQLFAIPFLVCSLFGQTEPSLELSSAFPLNVYQSTPRDYFMTTKYSVSLLLPSNRHADLIATFSYTQQQAMATQTVTPWDQTDALSELIYLPFTTDSYYSEYGFFTGIRLKTRENTIRAFVTGQLGMTGTKYGMVKEVAYTSPEPMPGGASHHHTNGSLISVQIAAMYGAGLLWNPISGLSILADLHAINRLTNQPLDVYRSIGVQFGL